jgi:hypothetical protein
VIHYHGVPITPQSVLYELAGRCFCVSHASPSQVSICHQIGQSVMLDNGAFTLWRRSKDPNSVTTWDGYYDWCERWLDYPTTWAVIPDVIDGTEEENDLLLAEWFQRRLPRGAPVWHLHESIDRLKRLAHGYERVCIGSSGTFSQVASFGWHMRMSEAMNALCGSGPVPVWLHMLRGMGLSGSEYPFASVDSTDIAQNHHRPQNGAAKMAARWDALNNKPHWAVREQLSMEAA